MKFLLSFYISILKSRLNIETISKYIENTKLRGICCDLRGILNQEIYIEQDEYEIEIDYFPYVIAFLRGTKEMNILIIEWLENINDRVENKTFPRTTLQFVSNISYIFRTTKKIVSYDSSCSDDEYGPLVGSHLPLFHYIDSIDAEREWDLYDRYDAAIVKSLELFKLWEKSRY
jgi:hypothetical protein